MFLISCVAGIEWKCDGVSEVDSSGPLTLLLVVAAVIFAVITSGVLPQRFARRKKEHSIADSFADRSQCEAESTTTNRIGDFYQPRSKREMRRHTRRSGAPKDVLIRPLAEDADSIAGLVLDRSRGGLQISAPRPATIGDHFRVRSLDAPDDVDWIVIQIRHCRVADDRWLWGCKFMRELPWGELLLFG